jgi:hypothetical protein
MDSNGLRTFQDLKEAFILPGNYVLLYLHLRSALLAFPLENQLSNHPMMEFINRLSGLPKGLISIIYQQLLESSYSKLAIKKVWPTDLNVTESSFNRIWKNMTLASRNPNHQICSQTLSNTQEMFYNEIGPNFQMLTVSHESGRHISLNDVGLPSI